MEGALPECKRNRDWWHSIPLEHDFDSSWWEAQRDEQENNNLTPHCDHWREGERDRGGEQAPFPLQNRRGLNERRTDNKIAAGREPGEPLQYAPSEWRADLNGREINFNNRCDSKWSTRWAWKTRTGRFVDQGMHMTRKWLMVGTISVMPQPQVAVGIMISIEIRRV